jgi:hypothetical protein
MSQASTLTRTAHPPCSCDVGNPWPGLLQYQEADREFFHGREVETDELLRLVMRSRLSLLFGLSGLGKSRRTFCRSISVLIFRASAWIFAHRYCGSC